MLRENIMRAAKKLSMLREMKTSEAKRTLMRNS